MKEQGLASLQKSDLTTEADVQDNFDMGESFCDVKCRHGHETRWFNIGRGHYVACDTCKTYVFVGADLMSSWQQENRNIWEANFNRVEGYKFMG